MTLSDHQHAFLVDFAQLIFYVHAQGWKVTAGEIYRTEYQQRRYVETGKSQTMNSKHLQRLAGDLNFFKPDGEGGYDLTYEKDDLQWIGDYWEGLDDRNEWGGSWTSFVDTPHFQRNPD